MTSVTTTSPAGATRSVGGLSARTLPRWAMPVGLAVAAALGVGLGRAVGTGLIGTVVLFAVVYGVGFPLVARAVEGPRRAADRLATTAVTGAFAIAMVPLISLLWTVVHDGYHRLDGQFFTYSMRNVLGEGGGAYHAIVGTVLITAVAALISVPIGLMTAIYLTEYGVGRLATAITFLVDVMTGIPSIVAGLFVYALFVLFLGPGQKMGIMGSIALSVLMIPIVIRSAEELFRLVPRELREAALALGVPKWRVVLKVVLPTAAAGLATGVTIAIARVMGETAPLLVTVGLTSSTNFDLFSGPMETLPTYAFFSYTQPGLPPEAGVNRAWTAALVLIAIVMVLSLGARLLSRLFAPKAH